MLQNCLIFAAGQNKNEKNEKKKGDWEEKQSQPKYKSHGTVSRPEKYHYMAHLFAPLEELLIILWLFLARVLFQHNNEQ